MQAHFSSDEEDEDSDEPQKHPDLVGLRRWLIAAKTNGPLAENAYCPDWYMYMVAAERLNCKPWELAEVPQFWIDVALVANQAENEANEAANKQRSGK